MTLWRHNDVRKFDADAIEFREIQCKKRDILMFLKATFSLQFRWESGREKKSNMSVSLH